MTKNARLSPSPACPLLLFLFYSLSLCCNLDIASAQEVTPPPPPPCKFSNYNQYGQFGSIETYGYIEERAATAFTTGGSSAPYVLYQIGLWVSASEPLTIYLGELALHADSGSGSPGLRLARFITGQTFPVEPGWVYGA